MDDQIKEISSQIQEIQLQLTELIAEKDKLISTKPLGKYHDIYLLLIGFSLTAMVGGGISFIYQKKMYDYQKQAINYESKQREVTEFYKNICEVITARYLMATRLVSGFEEKMNPVEINNRREKYFASVDKWSENDAYSRAFILNSFPPSVNKSYSAISDNFTKALHITIRNILKNPTDTVELQKANSELKQQLEYNRIFFDECSKYVFVTNHK